jgi:hypothetical protein
MANMLDELMVKLEERDTNTERVFFDFKDLSYEGGALKSLSLGSDKFKLSSDSFGNLCKILDVPKSFANRCDKSLQEQIFNHLFEKRKGTNSSLLTNKEAVRSFLSPEYPYVSSFKVVETEINQHDGEFEVGNYHLDSSVLEFVAFTPEFDQDVIDSPVRGGLRTVHADSWSVFPRFDTYLYRVICTNGALSPLSHRKFRVSGKSEDEILQQVKEFVTISLQQIPDMFNGFLALENSHVDNYRNLVRKVCLENKLPRKVRELIEDTASDPLFLSTIRGSINSMYDVVNLLTYVASHSQEISETHAEHLLSIAGNIMLHNSIRCVSCGGVVD